jgi:hypothetical protein
MIKTPTPLHQPKAPWARGVEQLLCSELNSA